MTDLIEQGKEQLQRLTDLRDQTAEGLRLNPDDENLARMLAVRNSQVDAARAALNAAETEQENLIKSPAYKADMKRLKELDEAGPAKIEEVLQLGQQLVVKADELEALIREAEGIMGRYENYRAKSWTRSSSIGWVRTLTDKARSWNAGYKRYRRGQELRRTAVSDIIAQKGGDAR